MEGHWPGQRGSHPGKLRAAGRHLAVTRKRGDKDAEQARFQSEEADAFGFPDWFRDRLARRRGEAEPADLCVFPENLPAVETFIRCSGRWQYAGFGEAVGLDPGYLMWAIERLETDREAQLQLADDVAEVEAGYLGAVNEKARSTAERGTRPTR